MRARILVGCASTRTYSILHRVRVLAHPKKNVYVREKMCMLAAEEADGSAEKEKCVLY